MISFSGGSVGTKIGSGLTSAIITGLMSWSGYISSTTADAVQPQSAIDMIVGIYEWGQIFVAAFTALVLYLYKLDKIYPQIMADLAEREARGEL